MDESNLKREALEEGKDMRLLTIMALTLSLGIAAPAFAAGGTSDGQQRGQTVGADTGTAAALDQFSAQKKKTKKKDETRRSDTQRSWWGGS